MSPSRARPEDAELAMEFGRRLRRARIEAGLTQEALAELAGVHATYVGNVERGYSSPTLGTIVRLAAALDVDAGEFVCGLRPS
jgi:transcriptional regulator with XRE-family HTH domain